MRSSAAASGAVGWERAGEISARHGNTATLLPDGRVLIIGGDGPTSTAYLFDPETNGWTRAADLPPHFSRAYHTATLLADGRVLVFGGDSSLPHLYDPSKDRWEIASDAGDMVARRGHTATLLEDGRVLVAAGGPDDSQYLANADELFVKQVSPDEYPMRREKYSLCGSRRNHTATLLDDGSVLIAGGWTGEEFAIARSERYLPAEHRSRPAAAMRQPRQSATATRLPDGRVLVVGGWGESRASSVQVADNCPAPSAPPASPVSVEIPGPPTQIPPETTPAPPACALTSAEIYDPQSDTWTDAAPMHDARALHAAVLLADGRLLVSGGISCDKQRLASAEIYDPAADAWTKIPDMAMLRDSHTMTLLHDGRVLVVGGGPDVTTVEVWSSER